MKKFYYVLFVMIVMTMGASSAMTGSIVKSYDDDVGMSIATENETTILTESYSGMTVILPSFESMILLSCESNINESFISRVESRLDFSSTYMDVPVDYGNWINNDYKLMSKSSYTSYNNISPYRRLRRVQHRLGSKSVTV